MFGNLEEGYNVPSKMQLSIQKENYFLVLHAVESYPYLWRCRKQNKIKKRGIICNVLTNLIYQDWICKQIIILIIYSLALRRCRFLCVYAHLDFLNTFITADVKSFVLCLRRNYLFCLHLHWSNFKIQQLHCCKITIIKGKNILKLSLQQRAWSLKLSVLSTPFYRDCDLGTAGNAASRSHERELCAQLHTRPCKTSSFLTGRRRCCS